MFIDFYIIPTQTSIETIVTDASSVIPLKHTQTDYMIIVWLYDDYMIQRIAGIAFIFVILHQVATTEAKKWIQKLKLAEWWLEVGSKTESIPIDHHVKMPNFTAEINMFTVQKNDFGLPVHDNSTWGELLYNSSFLSMLRLKVVHV